MHEKCCYHWSTKEQDTCEYKGGKKMGKLSGRMIHNQIDNMAVGAQVVILNEQGKAGMLQSLGVIEGTGGPPIIKIEVDNVTVFQGPNVELLHGKVFNGATAMLNHGMPVLISGSTSTSTSVMNRQRFFNLPFTNSLKITIINNAASVVTVFCVADYVIEV